MAIMAEICFNQNDSTMNRTKRRTTAEKNGKNQAEEKKNK